jgi:2-polyprenyl-3-methyl-5-hydroxy-6-metoxy-1,4-benzoquinol methylase
MKVNRLLTDYDRDLLSPVISGMWNLCPDMMRRKIERANIQQAFVLNQVRLFLRDSPDASIISIGCYDDTAYESLKKSSRNIVGIDPVCGYDLHKFRMNHNIAFDIAFSTSVLEHVADDEEFIRDMCDVILPGGYGILTMDFNDSYKIGDRLHKLT